MSAPRVHSAAFDLADVPRTEPRHLERLMAILVRQGHGLMLIRGADDAVLRAVEAEFWAVSEGDTQSAVAAMVRFRAVVDAFAARRLKSLLLNEGLAVLGAVFRVAASMRLNAARGFSPQGLVWGVAADAARIPAPGPNRPRASRAFTPSPAPMLAA